MIRPYEPKDTEAIIDVWYQATTLAHPFMTEAFKEKEKDNIRNLYLPNTLTWVYEQEGEVIGFISMIGHEVGAIFLLPEFHGQGIGRQLMDIVAALYATLEVEVFQANTIGRRFYDRYGFSHLLKEYRHEETGQMVLRLRYDPKN